MLCTHELPAHRKLLPRPCPQCGQENGGCHIVLFNPRYRPKRESRRYETIAILRISHYSKEQYALSLKKKRRTKIWHNFQIGVPGIKRGSESIPLDEIFDDFIYEDRPSITLPLGDEWFDYIKRNGWPISTEGAHWINKGSLKKWE